MEVTPSDSAPLSYADKLRAAKNPGAEASDTNSPEKSTKPVKNLVIDTGALIHYVQLHVSVLLELDEQMVVNEFDEYNARSICRMKLLEKFIHISF